MRKIPFILPMLLATFDVHATLPAKSSIVPVEQSICAKEVTRHVAFKDPSLIVVESVTLIAPQPIVHNGIKRLAKTYVMKIKAKNAIGGYSGRKLYFCHISDDESSVFKIEPAER